ncbi:MAG TPA: ABC transporter substrate-binding protein [Nocardioides sp.]
MRLRTAPRRTPLLALLTAGALALTACGGVGSTGPAATDGLPDTIELVSINPTTGLIAFAGEAANKGYRLAVDEINETDFLEGTRIELELQDTKSEAQTAAQLMTQAINGGSVSAVLGSVSSNEALAMSPLAESSGTPVIYTQSGSDGVITGDYTWRATPMMSSYYDIIGDFVVETGAESIGILYTEATPTLQEVGTETLPAIAADLGLEVVSSVGTPATTQDFSAPISQLLGSDPDVVAVLLAGAANPTAMVQVRQAGYDGPVLGNLGAGAGNLEPAGDSGDGMVWATNWHHDLSAPTTQDFVTLYEETYDETPLGYAAEAYDAAWFLARAIKEAGSADRESIMEAMQTLGGEAFDGALGEGLRWEDQDLVLDGAVVEWRGGEEVLLYEGAEVG